jgi:hypothetical protein
MNGTTPKVLSSFTPKRLRLDVGDGAVTVMFTPKGTTKSVVTLEQPKLPDRETKDRIGEEWSERLDTLREALTI